MSSAFPATRWAAAVLFVLSTLAPSHGAAGAARGRALIGCTTCDHHLARSLRGPGTT